MNKPLLSVWTWMTATSGTRAGARIFAALALLASAPFGAYAAESGHLGAAPLSAQQAKQPVSGTVTDESGEPLVGVTVMVKNTTTGTTTDAQGHFQLSVEPGATLVFSYLGYNTQEIAVGNKTSLKVALQDNSQNIDEVVVVAYGTQKKVSVTGSVSSVQAKELKQSSSANLSTALAGRLSGLTSLQQGGGQPGKDQSTLMLRGAATINGTSPLILIDGVPRDNMDYLSADEVDNVSVLKDASATAVFGVRGANGAILITTKRGQTGKAKLDLNFEQSWTSFTREPERLTSLEYIDLRNQASRNDHKEAPFDEITRAKYADPLKGLDPNDPDYAKKAAQMQYLYPNHDYYRELIKRYTPQTRVNMNISGGTEKVKYFVNAAYLHQGGNLKVEPKSFLGYDPSAKMDRYSFRANLDYQVTKSFKAFLNLGTYIEQVNMPSGSTYPNTDTGWMMRDVLYQATTITPITPGPYVDPYSGLDEKALVFPTYLDRSAMEVINRQGYHNDVNTSLNATLGGEWDLSFITKGLSLKGMASYDALAVTNLDAAQRQLLYVVSNVDDVPSYSIYSNQEYSPLTISKSAASRYTINLQASLNYNRTFGLHTVGGMLLVQRDYWETNGGDLPYNVMGLVARATYDFDNRYLFEFNMGYNGSEQFAPSNRYGFFPAVSAGWVISNEKFLKDSRTLTMLKLRASYGKVGNDKLGGNRFLYIDNITMGGGTLGSLGNGQGVSTGLLGNPNLSWEIAKKQNYGFDLQLWSELNLTFDYFIENREDILIDRKSVPMIQGTPLANIPKMNMGKVRNQGFEIELNYIKRVAKDLTLQFRGMFNYNKNKLIYMDEPINPSDYVYRYRQTGFPINTNWGYKIDYSNGNGFFNTQEELDEYLSHTKYSFGTPGLGDFKYMDLNDDGVVDEKDQVPLRYTKIPRITYGFTLGLDYKGIDFTIFFQGVSKYSHFSGTTQNVYEWTKEGTYYNYHKRAWTKERYENGEKITYPALHTGDNVNTRANDFFVFDRSFIRLKNIELGYTLPQRWLRAIGISKVRVYVSGQNLWTHSPQVADHIDPEQDDPIGYPLTKMMNVGVNITF